jgi:hypothetical protein
MTSKTTLKNTLYAFVALTFLFAAPMVATATAQSALSEEELKEQPGYVEFGDIWRFSDRDEEVEIHLTQPLLGVVGSFLKGEDPELADLILDLHLVKVNGFSFARSDEDKVREMMDGMAEKLRGEKWDNIVKVRERDERVNVFVLLEGDGSDPAETYLNGLAVLVLEKDEAALVNVVGRFRMEDIAKVGQHFDIPHTEDWDQYNRRRSGDDEEGR